MPGPWSPLRVALVLLAAAAIIGGALLHAKLVYPAADVQPDNVTGATCTPQLSVCFLKTHKCASSSIQNIMLRFGDGHDLSFVLPPASNYLGHPAPFHRSMAPTLANTSGYFDLLVHHARFNEAEMRHVLAPGAKFVTIVREPAELFESLYSYYDLVKQFRVPHTRADRHTVLRAWARQRLAGKQLGAVADSPPSADTRGWYRTKVSLERLTSSNVSMAWVRQRLARKPRDKLGLNQMSFDLGLHPSQFNDLNAVQNFIRRIDSAFDLVLVAERIRESLVLLKDLLCWTTDDVVTFRHNSRAAPFRNLLTAHGRARLRELNAADTFLYDHFAKRLDERIRQFGLERMQREVKRLDERTKFWYSRCVSGVQPVRHLIKQIKGVSKQNRRYWTNAKVVGFQARDSRSTECHRYLTLELVFTDEIRKRQEQVLQTKRPAVGSRKNSNGR
ncbi:galactosylceramide sulfotransferase-like isoform X2 [Ornithodoros turicata]|uniref:galactosylceramide sulfotransferase-like isoform X2 n=1 Tax=Ornithodoros turicata TaxID=34597 RepID=UPI00313A3560